MVHRHALHAQGEHDRQNRGQSFRYGGDGERYGEQQRIDDVVHVVESFGDGERRQHDNRDGAHGDAEDLGDVVHFLLQRAVVVFRGLQQVGDFADLGAHAGAGHDGASGALGDGRAVEHHVGAVAEGFGLDERIGFLADRHAFAGEAGFRDAQACRGEQASVGGYGVAFAEHDDVARHHVGGVDAFDGAVAHHVGLRRGHLGERLDRRFRLRFLDVAERRVDDEDEHDDDGVERQCLGLGTWRGVGAFDEPCDQRDAGRGEQQVDQRIFELREEFPPFRHGRRGCEFVRAILFEPSFGFGAAESGVRVDAERLRHLCGVGERRIGRSFGVHCRIGSR